VPVNDTPAFRAEALRGDAYSIEASRVALERSRNPKVRALANRTIEDRQATTDALLPPGSSLTAGGTVVADGSRGTAFDTPLGFITAPLAIPGAIVGGIVGGNAVVDSRPGEPGKRVALDAKRQETLTRLQAERGGRSFDKLYTGQQAVSNRDRRALPRLRPHRPLGGRAPVRQPGAADDAGRGRAGRPAAHRRVGRGRGRLLSRLHSAQGAPCRDLGTRKKGGSARTRPSGIR
jgi:hypothetical protein